ncbi:MAG: hypothetical protein EB127_26315, partial [Alphaproteobacteria bacterium]|nr:hypothetical protein [Alphaproteobacteria bacterium]
QLTLAQGAISALERSVGRGVRGVTFEGRGDITVLFDGIPFPVTFGAPSDSMIVLEDQVMYYLHSKLLYYGELK